MEIGYEFDSLSELPPVPQEFVAMEYYRNYSSAITPPLEALAPFPPSDFTFSDYNEVLQLQQQQQLVDDSFFFDSSLSCADSFFLDTSLSLFNCPHLAESTRLEQLFHSDAATPFLHLPDLKSFEQTKPTAAAMEDTTTTTTKKKNPYLSLSPSIARRRKKLGSSSSSTTSGSHISDGGVSQRMKISNNIRSLEKLMPWEGRKNLATILEESHKYIRYLQSQIASLLWMPLESVYNTAGEVGENDLLKSLTRQQILQVLANSPGSRHVLSTRGVCVISYEQLLSLKTMSRRNL